MARLWMGAALCLVALTGCDELLSNIDSDEPASGESDITQTSVSGESDADGLFDVEVEVANGQEAFMVTAWSTRSTLSVDTITDPNGDVVYSWQDWWNSDESLTYATWPFYDEVAINWPVRAKDGPLEAGTYTVTFATVTANWGVAKNKPVEATVQVKGDDDLDRGTVRVNLVWGKGLDDDAELVAAVDTALERWQEIWSDVGITLEYTLSASSYDPDMLYGDTGDINAVEWEEIDAEGEDDELTLMLGEEILGESDYYGLSGGIPGSLLPTERSVVILSLLGHAGRDGEFDDEETRIMGETMAHEIGHYMGLFHPVEYGWKSWDALDDTSDCSAEYACYEDLGDNLMFPYPVCDWDSCEPQGDLSTGQQGVLHRFTGTVEEL